MEHGFRGPQGSLHRNALSGDSVSIRVGKCSRETYYPSRYVSEFQEITSIAEGK